MSGYDGPGRYRHYKGGEYEVLGLAVREATRDDLEQAYDVVYRSPAPKPERSKVDFWSRPLENFNAMVPRPADQPAGPGAQDLMRTNFMPRFQRIRPIAALYFGTDGRDGHRWLAGRANGIPTGGGRALREWIERHCPWGEVVDGKLYDGAKQTQSECLLYHRDGWTAIAFAHRLDDHRGGCNGNFFFDTTLTFEQCVEEARRQFPQIMARLDAEAPLYLREDQRGTTTA